MAGVDTSFLIDSFRGGKAAALLSAQKTRLYVSEWVVYEFLAGNISSKEEERFFAFLDECTVFPFDRAASMRSAAILRILKKQGKHRSLPDVSIAGTYLANGVSTILTGNKKDFEDIQGLNVLSY